MALRIYIVIVGVLAAIAGLVVLTLPVSVMTIGLDPHSVSCGTAGNPQSLVAEIAGVLKECEDAASGRFGLALALIIGGLIVAIGAGIAAYQVKNATTSTNDTASA